MSAGQLQLAFEPRTVEHLGSQMYSHLPNAVAELVANSYDAESTSVVITVEGRTPDTQSITVTDDGHGMSFTDVQEKYLRIGRNRRIDEIPQSENGLRRVSGKKGIGKLALFGIGHAITVETTRRDLADSLIFSIDYTDLMASRGSYEPPFSTEPAEFEAHGTKVRISELARRSLVDADELAKSLARLFNSFDKDFQILVRDARTNRNIEVNEGLREFALNPEFTWDLRKDLTGTARDYVEKTGLRGKIYSAPKPLRQSARGISIYAAGRLVNEPEFFGASESSFVFSYLTGYVEADFLDDIRPDVISTDRRSLNWEAPETAELSEHLVVILRQISMDWREKRRSAQKKKTQARTGKDFGKWTTSVRGPESEALADALETITSPDAGIPDEVQDSLVGNLEKIAPEYADLLWRQLHPDVQEPAEADYRSGNYFHAVEEAIKRYISDVLKASGLPAMDARPLMEAAFGKGSAKLTVFQKYLRENSTTISKTTGDNIEDSQKLLSSGLVAGIRNPLAHEEKQILSSSGAFTYKDCLDALSLLSYLRRRLDDASLRHAE